MLLDVHEFIGGAIVKELLGHNTLNATEVYLRLAAPTVFLGEGYTNPLTLCEQAG